MAIVNRTPDSFYDKGKTFALGSALEAAEIALDDGADWLDIGGTPFSPLTSEVSVEEELDRVVPVIEALRGQTDAVISVDTFRSDVARRALAVGADAVNDTSGLHDPQLAEVVATAGAALVITHSKSAPRIWLVRPTYDDLISEVRDFLMGRAKLAIRLGVAAEAIIVDPGHDLNKNTFHSLELTRRFDEFAQLGYPALASVSNKNFIQETLNLPPDEVIEGTIAAVTACVLRGARIVRVHNPHSIVPAVRMTEAMLGMRTPTMPRHNLE